MITLKEQFVKEFEDLLVIQDIRVMTVAIRLKSGAIEVITNTEDTINKARYYYDSYDDEFRLKANPKIQIINFMLV